MRSLVRRVGLICCVWAAADVEAKTIVVKPGTAFATIQAGIDAAAPGDVVKVAAGVYPGTAFVPFAATGLRILAAKGAILDARGPGGVAIGTALRIDGYGVLVRGLTIRHAKYDGNDTFGVDVQGDDVRLESLRIEHCTEAILCDGSRTVVRSCVVRGCDEGIEISDSDVEVVSCRFENVSARAISTHGPDSRIRKNTFRDLEWMAIGVYAADVVVEDNRIDNCSLGIQVHALAPNAQVRGNRIRAVVDGAAIDSAATGVVIEHNVVEGSRAHAIRSVGDGAQILDNVARTIGSNGPVLEIEGIACVIEGNRVERCGHGGIDVYGPGAQIVDNVVRRCGSAAGAGIEVESDGAVIAGNVVSDCTNGIVVKDSLGPTIDHNNVRRVLVDGLHLKDVLQANVTNNVLRDNRGEGLDNRGVDTVLTGNTIKGNRIDVANAGSFGTFSGNVTQTGGVNTPPEID